MVKDAADDFQDIPSKTAVRKAGATVRHFVRDADLAEMRDHPLFMSAERVIDAYRFQFRGPARRMDEELRAMTSRMHDWAQLIESASRALAIDFKQEGAHPLQEFMKLESKRLAFIEGLGPNLTSREH